MLKFTKAIILAIILIFLIVFMVNNREIITINFYPLPFIIETRLFFMMIICFLVGIIFGLLIFSQNILKNSYFEFKNRKNINLNKELDLKS